jgi:outer membrane protein assembly factor BamB
MRRLVGCLALALSVSGCSWVRGIFDGDEGVEPPAQLTRIEPTLDVTTLWETRVGRGTDRQFIRLTPAVANGRVYAADTRGRVAALAADSGRTLWEVDTDAPISGGVAFDDGRVLVGTSQAEVIALSAEKGTVLWRAGVSSEVLASPQGDHGIVVAQTMDGRVVGLNAEDGTRLWVYQGSVPALTLRARSTPLIVRDAVFAGLPNGRLVALTLRAGRAAWETPVAVARGRSELERMVDISADPEFHDGVIYAVTYQGRVAAIEAQSGRVLWNRDLSSHAGLAVDERNVYLTDDQGQVWALDRLSGASLWKQDKLRGRGVTGPVVYGASVVVGDFEGYLHWLSKDSGGFQARVRVDSAGILVPGVVLEDTLYVAGRGGHIVALRAGR